MENCVLCKEPLEYHQTTQTTRMLNKATNLLADYRVHVVCAYQFSLRSLINELAKEHSKLTGPYAD